MKIEPLDPSTEVLDERRRWTPDWYGWLRDLLDPPLLGTFTVAALPPVATVKKGARALVTDANATTFASIVAGGGANTVPVYSDGTNWRIG